MDCKDLLNTRANWYEAFFSGNTKHMSEIEADSFLVVSEFGSETKKEQLQGIAAAVNAGQWFPLNTKKHDISVVAETHGNISVVSGHSQTMVGDLNKGSVFFSEVWCKSGNAWQVLHLHYTPAKA